MFSDFSAGLIVSSTRCRVRHLIRGRGYNSAGWYRVNKIPAGHIGSVRVVLSSRALSGASRPTKHADPRRPFIRVTRKTMWPSEFDRYAILSTYRNAVLQEIYPVYLSSTLSSIITIINNPQKNHMAWLLLHHLFWRFIIACANIRSNVDIF